MTDHTPEPWTEQSQPRLSVIHGPGGEHIADTGCWRNDEHPEMRANAARIVACVNACANIPTERLEKISVENILCEVEKLILSKTTEEFLNNAQSLTDACGMSIIDILELEPSPPSERTEPC